MNIFIIILKYIKPLEIINLYRKEHLFFLATYYDNGLLLISGRKVTQEGGVIVAISNSKEEINDFIKLDPFFIHQLAEYKVHEFAPTRHNKILNGIVLSK
jgi:uncharacterized protein YciI